MTLQLKTWLKHFPVESVCTTWRELVAWFGFGVFRDADDEAWFALGPLVVGFEWSALQVVRVSRIGQFERSASVLRGESAGSVPVAHRE